MAHASKGPRGSQQSRDEMESIYKLCREVLDSTVGNYCVNPEDDQEIQIYLDQEDVLELFLRLAENYVRYGTFENPNMNFRNFRNFTINTFYREKMKSGMSRKEAIEELAEKHHLDFRSIERVISNVKL